MRTIEEIQSEIDTIYAQEKELADKRYKLYDEIREVEKSELKDFTSKYIHSDGETRDSESIMCIFKQEYSIIEGKVYIEGPRMIIERKYNTQHYFDHTKDKVFKLYADYAKLEYDIDSFKDFTTGEHPKIEEISYEKYMEYAKDFTGEMRWLTNAIAWIESTNTIYN